MKRALAPLFAAMLAEVLLFIPLARSIDRMYPGPHAGFTLMGVWLLFVVPAALILGVSVLLLYPRAVAKGATAESRLKRIAWLLSILLLMGGIAMYRAAA